MSAEKIVFRFIATLGSAALLAGCAVEPWPGDYAYYGYDYPYGYAYPYGYGYGYGYYPGYYYGPAFGTIGIFGGGGGRFHHDHGFRGGGHWGGGHFGGSHGGAWSSGGGHTGGGRGR
jgi:hypothetical protein